jgi:alkylresorcinol/alkylpyrone synthase
VRRAPELIALATAVPSHTIRQADAKAFAEHLFTETLAENPRLIEVFDNGDIDTRYLCVPLEWCGTDHTFAEKNDLYVEQGVPLAAEAARTALARAGLAPGDVDHLVFVSSTGIATPSLDAHLINRLGFRSDIHRTPIWGLGCAGGAVGLARARDFALADPAARVLLVTLEMCSLSFQRNDLSKRNLVATSLFADGAAAAVVVGREASGFLDNSSPGVELIATQSTLWTDTLDVMGWTVDGDGLHVVFSRDIPTIVRDRVRPGLSTFLENCGLSLESLTHVVAHPGGVKVLRAYEEALDLAPDAMRHARGVLREYGNMSSPTCLFVLERFLAAREFAVGDSAIVAALGPGFSSEYVLLRAAA